MQNGKVRLITPFFIDLILTQFSVNGLLLLILLEPLADLF